MGTEYVPPSDGDSEDENDFSHILLKANSKVWKVDCGDYQLAENGNAVYTNLTRFQPQPLFIGEYFLFVFQFYLFINWKQNKK